MTRWAIAAAVAVLLGVLSLGGMFWFMNSMMAQKREWLDMGASLSGSQQTAIDVADWWAAYWYVGGPLLVGLLTVIVFFVAAVIRPGRRGG
jgi:hypothetical protein